MSCRMEDISHDVVDDSNIIVLPRPHIPHHIGLFQHHHWLRSETASETAYLKAEQR